MIYSTVTPDLRFRYYEGPGTFPPTGRYNTPRGNPINGIFPPRQFLPLLPRGVTFIGEGDVPQGVLSTVPMGLIEGMAEPVKRWGTVGFLVGLGWLLKTMFGRK